MISAKRMRGRSRNINMLLLAGIILAGLLIRVGYGIAKENFHVDEGITVALSNGNWEPGKEFSFRDHWIAKQDLQDSVFNAALIKSGAVDFQNISRATALDVHPPLFYWLFAGFRLFVGVRNYVLAGYILNLLLYLLSCIFFSRLVWRIWKDWPILFLALVCFVFSSAAISLTIFLRMYELLQTLCLAFMYCAACVLFPEKSVSNAEMGSLCGIIGVVAGVLGLFAVSFLGLMTHYYFLFLVVPVAAFAFVYLLVKKRISVLLWSVLAVAAGLYLAYRVFPAMANHLTGSYRAGQSFGNLVESTVDAKLMSLLSYIQLLSENLVPLAVFFAVVVLALLAKFKRVAYYVPALQASYALPAFILTCMVFLFTFLIIALSAPYRTLRYIAPFLPLYLIAFVGFTYLVLDRKTVQFMLGVTAVLIAIHGVLPFNICEFNEDYAIDAKPYYMHDDKPVIVMATPEGGPWKNMLLYINLGKNKQVYVTSQSREVDVTLDLARIRASSDADIVYAIVDTYFAIAPAFEKIGYYGFYTVYKIPRK